MSSISSSRKNRPNDARDSDYYELVGDFSSAVNDFLEAQGRPKSVMSPADYARQRVRHMVDDDESAESADTYAL